ncbi:MAG: hypothetical protein ACU85V_13485 [Gammaproteobacteria bacterium]
MRLTAFDEYPFHQHPTPFATAATSDAHYNDGYFVAFYAPGWYFFSGLRLHPNVNVLDGWGSVAHADRQSAVRLSRALHPRADALDVGPLRYEIVEPLHRFRVALGENPSGIEFDVVLEAQAPPFVEERYQHFKYGAVVNDLIRYTQVCRASGTARACGQRLDVDGWHAMRDHSWGVRSSMGVPTGIRGVDADADAGQRRALRLWVPFQVEDHAGFVNTHEAADGRVLDFEGRLDYHGGRSVRLTGMRHALDYIPGARWPRGGTLELDGEDGETRRYTLALAGTPADVQAGGYYGGWSDNLGAGVYRGADVLETDDYPTAPGAEPGGPPHVPARRRLGPTEFPMRMTGPGGAEGMAHFEHTLSGAYPRYGFE